MRSQVKAWLVGSVLIAASTTSLRSQAPAIPTAPAVPAVAAPTTAAAAAAKPNNLWSFLLPSQEQCDACRKKLCNCSLVQFLGVMLKPMTMMTGGLIKPHCPTPDQARPEDLAKPADSTAGASARIKQDEAEAKARRGDVRFLGTVDCSRYPEAEKALINALRTDRNECVRWEAALVLGQGCCCTKKTIEALKLTAMASDKDGNPKETSTRVRDAAAASLMSCQSRTNFPPEPPERPSAPPTTGDKQPVARLQPSRLEPVPVSSGIAQVQALAPPPEALPPAPTVREGPTSIPTGQRGVFDIFRRTITRGEPRQ